MEIIQGSLVVVMKGATRTYKGIMLAEANPLIP